MNRQNLWVIFLVLGVMVSACSFNNDTVTYPTTDTKIPYAPAPANGASNRENFQRLG